MNDRRMRVFIAGGGVAGIETLLALRDLAGVAFPELVGPALPGLPADDRASIPIDQHARVQGVSGVYAAGDGTNFPIKHGKYLTAEHWHRQPMALDPDSPLPE